MTSPPRTPTGRHITVRGRRWRASDPGIPARLREELVRALMAARRGVRGDPARGSAARRRVQDAKAALGERGAQWWVPGDAAETGETGDGDGPGCDAHEARAPEEQGGETGPGESDDGGEGERGQGTLWWQLPAAQDGLHARIDATARALCRARAHGTAHGTAPGTVCPSEVARCVAGDASDAWRALMPLVRARAERLVRRAELEITQRGEPVRPGEYRGPIRLRAAEGIDAPERGDGDGPGEGDGDREGDGGGGSDSEGQGEASEGEGTAADDARNGGEKGQGEAEGTEGPKEEEEEAAEERETEAETRRAKRQHAPPAPAVGGGAEADSLPLRSGKRRRR